MNFYDYLNSQRVRYLTIAVLCLIALILTLGLLTPIIIQLATGARLNLTPDYFNLRLAPAVFALTLLLAICLLLNRLEKRKIGALAIAAILLSIASFAFKLFKDPWLNITLPIFLLALAASIFKLIKTRKLRALSPHLIHFGLMLILIGVVTSTTLSIEEIKTLAIGDSWSLKNYRIELIDIEQNSNSNSYSTIYEVVLNIYKEGRLLDQARLKLIYDIRWKDVFERGYSKVYINRMLEEDLFLAIRGLSLNQDRVNLYAKISPLISMIWSGIIIMVIGIAIIVLIDRGSVEVPEMRDLRMKYEVKFQREGEGEREGEREGEGEEERERELKGGK
jgi:cytochrome c biogenesis factor